MQPYQWGLLAALVVGKPATVALVERLTRTEWAQRRRVYASKAPPEQRSNERGSLWMLLTDPLALALLIASGAVSLGEDTFTRAALTWLGMFVWVDVWMYMNHVAMHRWDWLWGAHAKHHESHLTQPSTAVSFSVFEKLCFYTAGWLLPLALVSQWLPVSLNGVVAFYAFYFVTSPIAHANVEIASERVHALPLGLGRMLGSPTSHAMHHARGTKNFGFLTTLPDRLFGTFWPDTQAVQHQVMGGTPLSNLQGGGVQANRNAGQVG